MMVGRYRIAMFPDDVFVSIWRFYRMVTLSGASDQIRSYAFL